MHIHAQNTAAHSSQLTPKKIVYLLFFSSSLSLSCSFVRFACSNRMKHQRPMFVCLSVCRCACVVARENSTRKHTLIAILYCTLYNLGINTHFFLSYNACALPACFLFLFSFFHFSFHSIFKYVNLIAFDLLLTIPKGHYIFAMFFFLHFFFISLFLLIII